MFTSVRPPTGLELKLYLAAKGLTLYDVRLPNGGVDWNAE